MFLFIEHYLLAAIVLANQQMYVSNTILECGGLSSVTRSLGSKLVYLKPLDSLIIPGRTGFLQLYSTTTDKVLYNVCLNYEFLIK